MTLPDLVAIPGPNSKNRNIAEREGLNTMAIDDLIGKCQFQNAKDKFIKSQQKKYHCAEVYYQQSLYFAKQNRI